MNTSTALSGVIGRIARLPDTPFEEIKSLWQQLFATPMRTHNRVYLERRIAYRMQEIDFAQREPAVLERNKVRIDALLERTKPKRAGASWSSWCRGRCSPENSVARYIG